MIGDPPVNRSIWNAALGALALCCAILPTVAMADEAYKAIAPRIGVYGCMNQDAMEMPGLQ